MNLPNDDSPNVMYGRLLEAAHISGYSFERLCGELEWLLEGDRWRSVGGGYATVNDFLRSIDLSPFNLGESRKKLHQRIKDLQPKASARAIADVTGASKSQVHRDLAVPDGTGAVESRHELEADAVAPVPSGTADPLAQSGREAAQALQKAADKEQRQQEKKQARDAAASAIRAEPPPLPEGPFHVIVVDPPWSYDSRPDDPTHRAANPYPSMTLDEIKALPVGGMTHEDSVLWLWTTNAHLLDGSALQVVAAWGFTPRAMLTWGKDRMGTGDWLRGRTEHCVMAVRGRPVVTLTNQTTLIEGPLREHSRKPDEFYTLVESLCPAPDKGRCELFQRTPRPGWTGHGNDTTRFS